jgi:hypothetical protein
MTPTEQYWQRRCELAEEMLRFTRSKSAYSKGRYLRALDAWQKLIKEEPLASLHNEHKP